MTNTFQRSQLVEEFNKKQISISAAYFSSPHIFIYAQLSPQTISTRNTQEAAIEEEEVYQLEHNEWISSSQQL